MEKNQKVQMSEHRWKLKSKSKNWKKNEQMTNPESKEQGEKLPTSHILITKKLDGKH